MLLSPTVTLFLVGVLNHVTTLSQGEWDRHTNKLILAGIVVASVTSSIVVGAFGLHSRFLLGDLLEAAGISLSIMTILLAGIFTSMTAYRFIFHRTRRFPGPILAKWTGWYWSYLYARNLHLYDEMMALHARYGDFVRIGKVAFFLAL